MRLFRWGRWLRDLAGATLGDDGTDVRFGGPDHRGAAAQEAAARTAEAGYQRVSQSLTRRGLYSAAGQASRGGLVGGGLSFGGARQA
ncbi:MAG: hypothetical protein Kow0010_04630 [Dehalococcoidia bacterium]